MKIGNIKKDDFFIEIKANDTDDFSQFSIINGLYPLNGGTHIQFIMDKIVPKIREKLVKKFKTIKPADIRNKMKIMVVARFVKNLEFTSQEKISISNSSDTWNTVFKDIDWEKIIKALLKDEDLMLSITEYFALKEQAKENAELKKLSSSKKKIKSDKYTKPVGDPLVLFVGEGKSAVSALLPGLGRKGFGYYELKGKPLNAHSASKTKFASNTELSELYNIIINEGYTKIVISADADLDGVAIVGLMCAYAQKYHLEELKNGMFYMLRTPIAANKKNKKIQDWVYSFDDIHTLTRPGFQVQYFKGLGTWKPDDMKRVIEVEGLDKMLVQLTYDENASETIDNWYSDKKSDKRKEMIQDNSFSIIKL
jgi:DNA topoisomerase-2